ncbi:sugar ABC transporter substrate-binding protein [Paenibacillus sp. J2TS4]|uniref:ABC transporter substrate-binding protein n=1 Tax=Paenibacillus sp. J2TS4 TaxID=2807194 RepID=UPI001B0E9788|nr:sugar ABC transporter substrate-binding protein [Paenibacillus sp. J2TS4]GIP31410.1 ABC transporter substrate-binding protein [Paenibacillus sp. J2TS4]
MGKRMNKKKIAAAVSLATVLMGTTLGCGGEGGGTTEGQAGEGKKPYEGVALRLVGANHPWTESIKPLIPEFEKETGMTVNLEQYFEDQLTQKITVEFTSGSQSIDVFMIRPLQEGKQFVQNGWVATLDKASSDQEWDLNDFTKSSIGSLQTSDQKLFGVPVVTEREILYYRKDLFEQHNLQPPQTLEEMMEIAKKLHDPSNEFYGFVSRGQRSPAVTQFSSFLYAMGGDFMQDGQATLNTPEAIEAFQYYGDMLKDYGPPGVLNMSWPQAAGVFAQGKVAMYTDADSVFPNMTDPSKSEVSDKVGFAVFPAGPKGQHPYNVTSWGLAINAKSKQQDAAWEFIRWATSKEITAKVQAEGNPGPRQSVWETEEGKQAFPDGLVDVINQSNEIGKSYDRPLIINVGQARDAIGSIIVKAITGEDVAKAAEEANKQFQELLDKESK